MTAEEKFNKLMIEVNLSEILNQGRIYYSADYKLTRKDLNELTQKKKIKGYFYHNPPITADYCFYKILGTSSEIQHDGE